jgi:hypothetical protein
VSERDTRTAADSKGPAGTIPSRTNAQAQVVKVLSLEAVRDALYNLVSSPAQPQYQETLATALTTLTDAAAKLAESITPSQASMIKQMGGEDFFDPQIADKVKTSIQSNAMTPSVARDFVQDLATRRSSFLSTVRSTRKNLGALGIRESALKPDSADIAFLIPRDIFKNHLSDFAKELTFISRLIQHFAEAITGQTGPVELEQLSSSIPTVTLLANVAVIGAIATVVHKFLEAWEKIEKIRRMRAELAEMGLKGTAIGELTEQVTITVDEVVEESTEIVIAHYKGDSARKSELENAVRQDTRRLFGQIERGLTIEFRAEPNKESDGELQKTLQDISDLGRQMEFPQIAKEPMLLENGQIIEGEIAKHSKKNHNTQDDHYQERCSKRRKS